MKILIWAGLASFVYFTTGSFVYLADGDRIISSVPIARAATSTSAPVSSNIQCSDKLSEALDKKIFFMTLGGLSFTDAQKANNALGRSGTADGKLIRKAMEYCTKQASGSSSGSVESKDEKSCESAYTKYNEANSELTKACSAVKSGGNCRKQLLKCTSCLSDPEDSNFDCEEDSTTSGEQNFVLGAKVDSRAKLNKLTKEFKTCPLIASEDLKDLKDNLKDKKDEIDGVEKDIQEAEQELSELQGNLAEAKATYDKRDGEIEDEFKEGVKILEAELRTLKEDYEGVIGKLESVIMDKDNELVAADFADQESKDTYNKAIDELEFGCLNQAQSQLSEKRERQLKLVEKGQFTTGNFNTFLKSSGLSSRERGLRFLNRLAADCMASDIFKNRKKKHDYDRLARLRLSKEQRKRIKASKASIKGQIAKLKRELPEKGQRVLKKLEGLTAERTKKEKVNEGAYKRSYESIQKKIALIQKKLNGDKSSALLSASRGAHGQNQFAGLQGRKASAKSEHQELVEVYTLKQKYAKGRSSTSSEDTTNAFSAINDFKQAARTVATACRCTRHKKTELESSSSHANKLFNLNSAACKNAAETLDELLGESSDNEWDVSGEGGGSEKSFESFGTQ